MIHGKLLASNVEKFAILQSLLGFLIPKGPMVSGDYLYRHSYGQYDATGKISLRIIVTTAEYKLKRILPAIIQIVLM
ncbi:hypothetical protein AWS26_12180 [Enterobacter hormaechei subsp. steigerwaltii]|nr:hypothetical protein ABF78_11395 [Enterobacter asburiae]KTK06953.1 hypothetical protein ASU68_13780 [Enterobacter hormaechei subsp. oharae]KVJ69700.1 hypothetical protein AWS26_12180 [Enterobacter hormaechei subsp. steigerwaltii]OHY41719.1 hypothetical protein BBX43_24680 [Enterobacter roggenkampii]KTK10140.1 hypothetical protein ASU69_21740 [Enterobacter hormaechei subsp. oharae]